MGSITEAELRNIFRAFQIGAETREVTIRKLKEHERAVDEIFKKKGEDLIKELKENAADFISAQFTEEWKITNKAMPFRDPITSATTFYREFCNTIVGNTIRLFPSNHKLFKKNKNAEKLAAGLLDNEKRKNDPKYNLAIKTMQVYFLTNLYDDFSKLDLSKIRKIHKHLTETMTEYRGEIGRFIMNMFFLRVVNPVFGTVSANYNKVYGSSEEVQLKVRAIVYLDLSRALQASVALYLSKDPELDSEVEEQLHKFYKLLT